MCIIFVWMQNKRRERRENMKLMSNIPPPNIPISNGKKLEYITYMCITKTISLNILCIPQKTLPPRKDTRKMFENTRGSVAIYIYMMLLHTLDELDRENRFIRANLYTAIWFPE